MVKENKIKIIKKNTQSENSNLTFINDERSVEIDSKQLSSSTSSYQTKGIDPHPLDPSISEPDVDITLKNSYSIDNSQIKKIDGKYTKKKKALDKNDALSKSNIKGLKFNNPSQRNHSSVYE